MNFGKKGIPQIETMLKDGFLFERDGYLFTSPHFPIAVRDEKFKRMKNFVSTKNALIVAGLPKTGSHLTMSILDSLGFERAQDVGDENGITALPFDFQHTLKGQDINWTIQTLDSGPQGCTDETENPRKAFDRMEEKLKSTSNPLILPHCHLYANFFPDDFQGKIIHVTRDPRAVVTSAWHFFTKLPHYNHYFDTWVGCCSRGDFWWWKIVRTPLLGL